MTKVCNLCPNFKNLYSNIFCLAQFYAKGISIMVFIKRQIKLGMVCGESPCRGTPSMKINQDIVFFKSILVIEFNVI